jgi:hypothetical protein
MFYSTSRATSFIWDNEVGVLSLKIKTKFKIKGTSIGYFGISFSKIYLSRDFLYILLNLFEKSHTDSPSFLLRAPNYVI